MNGTNVSDEPRNAGSGRLGLRSLGRSIALLLITFITVISAFFIITRGAVTGRADETEAGQDRLSIDVTGDGSGYSAILYDMNNGLPTSESNAVLVSREGSVWIGGYAGLIRYDGASFTRVEGNTNIASVISLFEDSKGRLWVGTNDSGAAVLLDWNFKTFNREDGLRSSSVRDITEDDNGNIYLATTEGLYYLDNDLVLHEVNAPQLTNAYVRSIKTGRTGVIYGVTLGKDAIFTVEDGILTGYYNVAEAGIEGVRAVLPDPEDPSLVYIGTEDNIIYYGSLSGDGFTIQEKIKTRAMKYVNSLEYVGGMIWVCGDNGFGYIDEFTYYPFKNTPMNQSIEMVCSDYLGNLWFASSKQGVMKVVPNQFTDIYWKNNLASEVVNTTCLYRYKLFIGTKNGGIRVVSNAGLIKYIPVRSIVKGGKRESCDKNLVDELKDTRIRCIESDSKGNLWICTFSDLGLVKYNDGEMTIFTRDDGLPCDSSERIRCISEMKDGSLAICCTGGLAIMKDDKIVKVYDESSGIRNTEILTCACLDNGEILLGTDGGGIYRIDGNNVTHIGVEQGLSSEVVLRIKKDKTRPVVWVITSNSLGYIGEDNTITTLDAFPYSNNFDLIENSKGEMWVLSSNGIYVSKVDDLLDGGDISALHYGTDNGLQCMPTSNSYSYLDENGDLYIAGSIGVSRVNIEKEFENVKNFKLSVPYVSADGRYLLPTYDGSFVIPSDTKKLSIGLFVYNYSLMNPDVSYELVGVDKAPVVLKRSELKNIDYTNLKGGEYKFNVSIKDPRGMSAVENSFRIVKEKSFFEQKWVRLLMVVFVLAVILIAVKIYIQYRTRKLVEKEQEQRILIREMVEAFAKIIDMKDRYTNGHSTRVAQFTALLTRELGFDEDTVEKNYNIALLHDIGKIGIPPEVLNKNGKLDDNEYEIIKSHSPLGFDALKDIGIMPELAIGAGCHHERPDGKGYPKGLKGDEIPRVAQIIAVADTFDAMYSDRPYRKHMDFNKVIGIMKEISGTQLTSDVVDAFIRLVEKGEIRAHLDEPEEEE